MTIGERIKVLRKKNDLTQEKLAEYLCVSYQAISKWECGLSCPDLSLIGPLTKLLHVSADELLGLTDAEGDERYASLEKAYDNTFKTGDLKERIRISAEAVKEYPGDLKWLANQAWDIWCIAISASDPKVFEAKREKAIGLFQTVIENCENDEIKCNAIVGIVQCLCGKGCKKEAKYYADLYPDVKISRHEKEYLLAMCLEGEEKIRLKQSILEEHFSSLIRELLWQNDNEISRRTAESIIEIMIPDQNYLSYHQELFEIKIRDAQDSVQKGELEETVIHLKKAMYHAKKFNEFDYVNPRKITYTAPLFDHLTEDPEKWFRTGTDNILDIFREQLNDRRFDSVRNRDDFKELMAFFR